MIYCVYILTNMPRGTLYIGVTNNLQMRILEHRAGLVDGFSKKYDLKKLVYFEQCGSAYQAISLEKRLKRWHRDWKISLIEKNNPAWIDLYEKMFGGMDPETAQILKRVQDDDTE
ncbi:GIY-YIG nuclease family protein [Candidatus Dependentiae bacterium]|nr:GIY-YIG nuclease family protein [Candidatus Dependentiae bacterium]